MGFLPFAGLASRDLGSRRGRALENSSKSHPQPLKMANDTMPPAGEELVEFGGDLSKIAEVGNTMGYYGISES